MCVSFVVRLGIFAAAVGFLAAAEAAVPQPGARIRPLQVLYLEGTPRWEYRHLRTTLDRRDPKHGKVFEHNVVLFEADLEFVQEDPNALAAVPTGAALDHFHLVILGDVDPTDKRIAGATAADLARYVREGGRLLVIAGPHHVPQDLKGTALEAALPIEILARPVVKKDRDRSTGYRPVLTDAGRKHPAFRFDPDGEKAAKIWGALPEMYCWAEWYQARPGAEVLATHPRVGGKDTPFPLVVWQKYEKGQCAFVGFDETWRWRKNEGEQHYYTFWTALWQSLAAD